MHEYRERTAAFLSETDVVLINDGCEKIELVDYELGTIESATVDVYPLTSKSAKRLYQWVSMSTRDTMTGSESNYSRRTYIKGVSLMGTAGMAGLAGCLGGGDDSGGNGGKGGGGNGGGDGGSGKPLEVLHGWTGGDGAEAVRALIEGFNSKYPDMKTDFRGIGGGGNVNLNALVARRLANNNPPSSFAGWPGANLIQYKGILMDIEKSVWEQAGLKDVIIDPAQRKSELDGQYVAVPIGSHRMNNFFFNKHVVNKAGVDPTSLQGVDDLIDAYEKIQQNTDAVPLAHAMKASWTNVQFWVQMLISEFGKDAYIDFTNGKGDKGKIKKSLKATKTIFTNYINNDAATINFTTANQKVISGRAATIHNGNWLYGMYRAESGFKYKKDWGWAPFPGTENMYVFHLDAFIPPSNNPSPEKTVKWQRYVGSKEAQVAFNKRKGSVPLRTDVDPNKLGGYLAMTYKDLLNADELPPTLAHGLAVPPEILGNVKSVFGNHFMGPFDVEATTQGLLDAVPKDA